MTIKYKNKSLIETFRITNIDKKNIGVIKRLSGRMKSITILKIAKYIILIL
jgi:hypothetical protein